MQVISSAQLSASVQHFGQDTPAERQKDKQINQISQANHSQQSSLNNSHGDKPRQLDQSPLKNSNELTPQEEKQVQKLKARDREVRAHEQAHKSAAGGLASGATYEYETGPDGKQYAIAGEVKIDTSPVLGNPEATARKARQIQKAATAPSEPSAQDIQVATQAAAMEQQANLEKNKKDAEEKEESKEGIIAAAKNEAELDHKSHTHSTEDKGSLETSQLESKDNQIACAICGGTHSGESHTEINQQKLNKVLESVQEVIERASVFSLKV